MGYTLYFDDKYIDTNGNVTIGSTSNKNTQLIKHINPPIITDKGEFKLFNWCGIKNRKIHSCYCDVIGAATPSCGNKYTLAIYCRNCLTLWYEYPYSEIYEIQVNISILVERIYIINDIIVLPAGNTIMVVYPNGTTNIYENCTHYSGPFIISKNEYDNWVYKKNNLFVYVMKCTSPTKTKLSK
jgi:hypothetical protein